LRPPNPEAICCKATLQYIKDASTEQTGKQSQHKLMDCRELLISARNVVRSAAFVFCNHELVTWHKLSGPVLFGGILMSFNILVMCGAAWMARIAALQVKNEFEFSLASLRTLADQNWNFTSDLEERLNSIQR
jgi:hypothetical protein